ncbi:MAG TPA: glucose 1-dehydrogenase [Candidatus Methylomirabilis sp.]|nr:glucose 1-dehydrogenase [Candidatus Methylomirabilis sp.]
MKAIALVPGTATLRLVDRAVPSVAAPDEVKMRVLCVGICGTDREEVAGGRAAGPEGQHELVIGHEMFGRVVEVGRCVTRVQSGDYAVFTVRRGCGKCLCCAMNRPDMCRTGDYRERGIWGLDGYQAEYVVDREPYLVRVPPELKSVGALCEPLSVAEKAIDEAVRLQSARLPDAPATPDWLHGRRCLVAGLGPIGLLAGLALRLRGAEVYGLDVVDSDTARPQWLAGIGGHYVDGRTVPVDRLDSVLGPVELILEATGIAALEFNLLDALAPDGIYVLTGIPGGNRPLEIPGAELMRRVVLDNQVLVGSVNAARDHFQMAVNDLAHAHLLWGDHVEKLITRRHPSSEFEVALRQHPAEEIKSVIEWAAD